MTRGLADAPPEEEEEDEEDGEFIMGTFDFWLFRPEKRRSEKR